MKEKLRIVIADDERPARSFLAALLRSFDDVTIVGEAASGKDAVTLIERDRPDLALLDLRMPELDGLGVVRAIRRESLPLVAFVTAFEEYAVRAFDLNAVDYLLKPVDRARLRQTINRAQERAERADLMAEETGRLEAAIGAYDAAVGPPYRERLPVRHGQEVHLLPVQQIASIVADGEILVITTVDKQQHTIVYRLRDLELKLDPARFIRLGRGTLANIDLIAKVIAMPGGTRIAVLRNGQELQVSRLQSRMLRDRLLRL